MELDRSNDEELKLMSDLNWLPWIGTNYSQSKIIILGESHYEDGEGWLNDTNATRHFVNNQGLSSHLVEFKNRKIFQNIEKTLLNKIESTFQERQTIWNSVTYMNLVQRSMSSINERPNDVDYEKGWGLILKLVPLLKPKVIIKCGYAGIGRLGFLIAQGNTGWEAIDSSQFYKKPFKIDLTNGEENLTIIFTHHPTGTRGYSYKKWHQHILENYPEIVKIV